MANDDLRAGAPLRSLVQYTATAQRAAAKVIRDYSTSFYAATRLLGRQNRAHICSIYALVRVADELVDGVSRAAGLSPTAQLEALDQFETATLTALGTGFSTDLVIHAFAHTARVAEISVDLVAPFFESMRTDLRLGQGREQPGIYDEAAHREYVYGSAEVVGLMCLAVFSRRHRFGQEESAVLEHGARQLGAALQNINFLRDISDDTRVLGRHYLGTLSELTPTEKHHWVEVAREQLAAAHTAIAVLPRDSRYAVLAAHNLFADLLDRIDAADCGQLHRARVRVPYVVKAQILTQSMLVSRFPAFGKLAPPAWKQV